MDEGLQKAARGIEAFGFWFRLSAMLALAVACLLAMQSLRTTKVAEAAGAIDTSASGMGFSDELARLLEVELPMKFSEIIVQGQVSPTTAGELYQQHHAGFEIRNWRYHPSSSRYTASIRLSWQPDATPGPGENFWVIAHCSVNENSSTDFDFEVRKASPDYLRACHDYFEVIIKRCPLR